MKAFAETFLNPPQKKEESKTQKQKILFLIGGITQNTYAFEDLINYCNNGYERFYQDDNGLIAFGGSNTQYLFIKEIDCEKYFDSKLLSVFSKPLLFGLPFRLWDRMGDYFKAILNENKMLKISNCIEEEIENAKKTYGLEVDIIAHSLGTLLALSAQSQVNNAYLFGSPLTSKYFFIRKTAQNHLKKHKKLQAQNFYYGWSKRDIVCTEPIELDLLCANKTEYNCSHSLREYLQESLKKGIIKC